MINGEMPDYTEASTGDGRVIVKCLLSLADCLDRMCDKLDTLNSHMNNLQDHVENIYLEGAGRNDSKG